MPNPRCAFVGTNDAAAPPAYRLLEAVAEIGEVTSEVCTATGDATTPDRRLSPRRTR